MTLPARKTLSVLVVFVLATSFLVAVPMRAVAISSSNGSDNIQSQNAMPLTGFRSAGPASPDLQVLVNLAIPLRNPGLLTSMVQEVSDPTSPMFHKFLTPSQIQRDFLPTAQYSQVMDLLQGSGMTVVETALDSIIVLQGSVAQVEQFLHADVNLYSNGTASYYASGGSSSFHGAQFVVSNETALLVKPRLGAVGALPDGNVTFADSGILAKTLGPVYNVTALYSKGFEGQGETVGIMDFFGNPTVAQDLKQFDQMNGFPDANLTIIPVGPYNPNLGVAQGWDAEIDLDVQTAHSLAPKAAIDLYIPNNALTFTAQLGPVVAADKVTDLSMSFGYFGEWQNYAFGPTAYYFNVFYPDQLFALGSLEGITFMSASGDDGGGGGYSTSPAGQSSNPDDSPFVTSVGASQAYTYTNPNGTETIKQTGWSNEGYVPIDGENNGGSGGGVSFTEPKPWYQQNIATPPSYPNGRMEPDLALQGACDPATDTVIHGTVYFVCGTSQSSPLLGGLLTLVASYTGSHLGLINPFLYSLGSNPAEYTKAFTPITVGYNIPWTSTYGYNMVTGWGAPNIGEMAALMKSEQASPSLSIAVSYVNSTGAVPEEFVSGQSISINASITDGGSPVSTGSFSATIVSLSGSSSATLLSYDPTSHLWKANVTVGSQSGFAYVEVSGSSGVLTGSGFAEIFAGYISTFYSPTGAVPWDTKMGIPVIIQSTDLAGNPAPTQPSTLLVNSYSLQGNAFSQVDSVALTPGAGPTSRTNLTSPYPSGPLLLTLQGDAYGIDPIMNGISLQNNEILPEVAAEPGAVAPGQSLTIIVFPQAPVNVATIPSAESPGGTVGSDVATGSNVSASLVNPLGVTVAKTDLSYVPCLQALEICGAGAKTLFNGQLTVPPNASQGLYSIILTGAYNSITVGYTMNGSYYGQIMVTSGPILPKVTFSPTTLYQGQTAKVIADIRYSNDQEVTFGEFTAVVYPQNLEGQYTVLEHAEFQLGVLLTLHYDPTMNRWTANMTVPSGANAGPLGAIDSGISQYSGPFEVFVTGISWDGVPTTGNLSAQNPFFIQPYVYSQGQTLSSLSMSSGLVLSGDTITASGSLTNDIFTGSNTIQGGTVTITGSQITGTLNVNSAKLTLVDVSGGNIVASGSSVTLLQSGIGNLTLTSSTVNIEDSSYQSISPSVLTLQANGVPTQPISGTANITITATGQDCNSLAISVDGNKVGSYSGAVIKLIVNASALADGVHSLQATATQTDGLSSSATWYFSTNAHLVAQDNALNSAQSTLQSTNSTLSNTQKNLTTTTDILYVALVIAVIALVVAAVALVRKPKAQEWHPPSPSS